MRVVKPVVDLRLVLFPEPRPREAQRTRSRVARGSAQADEALRLRARQPIVRQRFLFLKALFLSPPARRGVHRRDMN